MKDSGKALYKWIAAAFCVCLFLVYAFSKRLVVRNYEETSPLLEGSVRLALLTDLHAGIYGNGQETLLRALRREEPDVILLAGDIADDEVPDDGVWMLLSEIGSEYPCFYVSGNHEFWSGRAEELKQEIEAYGVTVLEGEGRMLEVNGTKLQIFGVDDPDRFGDGTHWLNGVSAEWMSQLAACEASRVEGVYSVLMSHRPELVQEYEDSGFDLVVSGHAHGGQIRIPLLLNGLFAPNQGWVPRYAGGRYALGDTAMIVSRGLCRNALPRLFNRPELVIIEIGPSYQSGTAAP